MSDRDLHRSAPDTHPLALLLVDVVNDFDFEGGERLVPRATRVARRIAALASRCRDARVPVVYVNDNRGRWRSDLRELVARCTADGVPGAPIARLLAPDEGDYFVVKPKLSGFYATTLEVLLRHLATERVIVAGFTTDRCVRFTANDAYLREYGLWVPADTSLADTPARHRATLRDLERVIDADVRASHRIPSHVFTRRPGARTGRGGGR